MKKSLVLSIIACICFLISPNLLAQTNTSRPPLKLGAKVGFSLGKLSAANDNIYTQDYESVSGVDFGITLEFPSDEHITIQTEINYTQRGGLRKGLQPVAANELSDQLNQFLPFIGMPKVTDENPLYADFESESDLNYIEIPVLVKFTWGDNFRFYTEVGPYIGLLLSANQITAGTSQFYFDSNASNPVVVPNPTGQPPFVGLPPQSLDQETGIRDDLRRVNFGGSVGLGVIQKLNEQSDIYLSARASYGFNAIQFREVFGKSHIGGVIFSMGYTFKIDRK